MRELVELEQRPGREAAHPSEQLRSDEPVEPDLPGVARCPPRDPEVHAPQAECRLLVHDDERSLTAERRVPCGVEPTCSADRAEPEIGAVEIPARAKMRGRQHR